MISPRPLVSLPATNSFLLPANLDTAGGLRTNPLDIAEQQSTFPHHISLYFLFAFLFLHATGTKMTTTTANDVFWFIPNLIGYLRVAMALGAFTLMAISGEDYGLIAVLLYIGSFVGDLFDGMAARKLNQCSVMGGLLDMITDRCATLGFLYILSGDYAIRDTDLGFPAYRLLFLALMILDISSHWCQMYSSSLVKDGAHHKSEEGNAGRHFLVRWFYKYYWFFGYLCVGAEFTYICLYVVRFAAPDSLAYTAALYLLYACIPGCAAKQAVNLMQLSSACYIVAQHDAQERNSKKQ